MTKPVSPYYSILKFTLVTVLLVLLSGSFAFSQLKRFTMLVTTDEHSTLLPLPLSDYRTGEPGPAKVGYPRLATLIGEIRESIISFLPMVGEILPRLKLVLKDADGNTVYPDDAIIRIGDSELKVWEAVARYARTFDSNDEGLPSMPLYYSTTRERIISREGIPLKVWSYSLIVTILVLLFVLLRFLLRLLIFRFK